MKKILTFILFCITTAGFAQEGKFTVVASASMIADITQNITAGDKNIQIKSIVPIGGDPHRYQPSPGDAKLVQFADLVLINGLTFEGWINELIENSGTAAPTITVTEGVQAIESSIYANSSDPHAWMDAANGIIYAENIMKALSRLNPANENIYQDNFVKYKAKLEELDKNIKDAIAKIPAKQRILITSHDAFNYYGKKYGLKLEAIMGISTEAQAQTSDITRVTNVIKEYDVPAVFIESTINPKMLQQIAIDNKVEIGGQLYADSLGDENSPASTYIDMLWSNTMTIVEALSKDSNELSSPTRPKSNHLLIWVIIGAFALALLPIIISKIRQ